MRTRAHVVLMWVLFVTGACTLPPNDPPSIPDPVRFVPLAVTLPSAETQDEAKTSRAMTTTSPLLPVLLPPSEAVPTVRERSQVHKHGKQGTTILEEASTGSFLTPTRGGFADNTSAILRYPYRTGTVYL